MFLLNVLLICMWVLLPVDYWSDWLFGLCNFTVPLEAWRYWVHVCIHWYGLLLYVDVTLFLFILWCFGSAVLDCY
jgi:hypothetical protein